jgi:hypothetical protein
VWEQLEKVIKYHGMSFSWEDRLLISTWRRRQTEMKDKATGLGREQKGCPDILGKGGEVRAWRQDALLRD